MTDYQSKLLRSESIFAKALCSSTRSRLRARKILLAGWDNCCTGFAAQDAMNALKGAEFDQWPNCRRYTRKSSNIRLFLFTLSRIGRPFSIRATLSSFGIEGFSRTRQEIKICAAIKSEEGGRSGKEMQENREMLQVTVCHVSSSVCFFFLFISS